MILGIKSKIQIVVKSKKISKYLGKINGHCIKQEQ